MILSAPRVAAGTTREVATPVAATPPYHDCTVNGLAERPDALVQRRDAMIMSALMIGDRPDVDEKTSCQLGVMQARPVKCWHVLMGCPPCTATMHGQGDAPHSHHAWAGGARWHSFLTSSASSCLCASWVEEGHVPSSCGRAFCARGSEGGNENTAKPKGAWQGARGSHERKWPWSNRQHRARTLDIRR